MLWVLVEKEIKNNLLSLRFLLAFLVVAVTIIGSFGVRIDDYVNSTLDRQANETGQRQGLRDVGWWWHFQRLGMAAEKPIQPLSVLVTGVEGATEKTARVFQRDEPNIRWTGSLDRNPMQVFSSPVDVMFITGIVMSLIVLVLSFDAVAGEQEQGTLKLLLSFPVPRSTFMFAKWLGGILTLSIPFAFSYLCTGVWVLLSRRIVFTGQDWLAWLLIGAASLLYIAWMFSAALIVSCWFRRAATAMCMLLFLWVVVVLVIPNVSPYVAVELAPTESFQAVNSKIIKATQEVREEEWKRLDEIGRKYGTERWWEHDKGWPEGVDVVTELHNKLRQTTRGLVDDREAKIGRQVAVARNIGRISPFVSYAHIVTALAWTGPEFGRHVMAAMREFEDQLRRVTTEGMKSGYMLTPESIPFFRYKAPPVARRFALALLDWVLLLSGTVILFLGAYVSFITREVH